MKAMHELREMLAEELEKITKVGELDRTTLDFVDKLTHSIKSIDTILAMEEASDDYSYNDGYSNARGRGRNARRDSMGRYSREGSSYEGGNSYRYGRGGYSRDDRNMQETMTELQELMNKASDNKVRMAIQRAIQEMQG